VNRPPPPVLDQLVGQAYDAALEPQLWSGLVASLLTVFRVQSAHIYVTDPAPGRLSFSVVSEPLPRSRFEEYYGRYIHEDPNLKAKLHLPLCTATATNQLMRDAVWRETAYYYDFLRRYDTFYQLGALIANSHGSVGAVGMQRARRAGPFEPEDIERLGLLSRHVQRALGIAQLVQAERGLSSQLLEQIPHAVFIVNAQGAVVEANGRAARLLLERDGLGMARGRLEADAPEAERGLARAIRAASPAAGGGAVGGTVQVSRPSGRRPYQVVVAPFARIGASLANTRRDVSALVIVSDPEAVSVPFVEALQRQFGLTRAEARVALALAQGLTPQQIAERHQVRVGTVRIQLKAVYGKLGVHRQSQVVAAVLAQQGPDAAPTD
jgi:DNA-binding CsgD family transcriptional regulator